MADDQWSDALESFPDDNASVQMHPTGIEQDTNIQAVKVVTSSEKADEQAGHTDVLEDGHSVRSMSAAPGVPTASSLNVARQPLSRPQSPLNPPPSPSRSTASRPMTPQERRVRRRSTTMSERPSNRLSGFLNNLIHRREGGPSMSSPRSLGSHEDQQQQPPAKNSRSSSPAPAVPARPITPPPSLPPPTLNELGLSLSVITPNLSPSHFSTPPTSGAFLAPNYLLLCHAQGLDVLPLKSPPVSQPYPLIRRVPFKSVVVMEHRGVLVAIAGRRDGVRVYALEEIKKAVERQMEYEVKREREKERAKTPKKAASREFGRGSTEDIPIPSKLTRRSSHGSALSSSVPLIPRKPTIRKPKTAPASTPPLPSGPPPPYPEGSRPHADLLTSEQRPRQTSLTQFLTHGSGRSVADEDSKVADWPSSDEEAIDVVAAPSGSQALDERTSSQGGNSVPVAASPPTQLSSRASTRRNRPANLDLSLTRANSATTVVPQPEPSPAPTLISLQQALSGPPADRTSPPDVADPDDDEDEDIGDGRISLAQALFESRLPNVAPAGTTREQEPALLGSHEDDFGPSSPRTSDSTSMVSHTGTERSRPPTRRRWSVLDGVFTHTSHASTSALPPSMPHSAVPPTSTQSHSSSVNSLPSSSGARRTPVRRPSAATFTPSHRNIRSEAEPTSPTIPSSVPGSIPPIPQIPRTVNPLSTAIITPSLPSSHSRSRFIPRIISNAFNRKSEDTNTMSTPNRASDVDGGRRNVSGLMTNTMPPYKPEYVKLPGTKGALMVKAVETPKKSFLAILCGDNGEKVELFAGTYRTALGLSRTFILPDSPRSLELQLQGDDLVEVFLVFNQNVFGLEPATVRVREVRIGRAERRAARRRARELRGGDSAGEADNPPADEDVNVNVSIGISVPADQQAATNNADSSLIPAEHPNVPQTPQPQTDAATDTGHGDDTAASSSAALVHAEEVLALATANMGPYTTFQQLSFAPRFPLASIADDYIIPPTYPDFLDYRNAYEPEVNGDSNADLAQIQFSPPGLPVPTPTAPSKWYYRDPKNIVHGPWKATLMQSWYKDGLLPPDLPIRREEETEYTLLKELRQQSVDPSQPFKSPPPPPVLNSTPHTPIADVNKPLLTPISLLAQPKHFGPPPLFYSTRGGHSTAIVDARGRSVLKGRFLWTDDEESANLPASFPRMGDVKRVEAFDIRGDRAVLVAMRQGGLEVVDLGDALLKPADESRSALPQFAASPSSVSRRGPFVWRMGTPVSSSNPKPGELPSILPSRSRARDTPIKKLSTGPNGRTDFGGGDGHGDEMKEEVLFLGRKEDELYLCERNAGSFRILRLCPT